MERIKIDLIETGCEDVKWIDLVQNGVLWLDDVYLIMNIWVLLKACACLTSLELSIFQKQGLLHWFNEI